MTKQASLHKVRVDGHVAIFRIDAPAVSGSLTRTWNRVGTAMPTPTLTGRDVSPELVKRICTALKCTSGLTFSRNEKGKWFVRAVLRDCQVADREQLRQKKAERISRRDVPDNDGRIAGKFNCGRCAGTGRYITAIENGKPVGPGGECFRCAGKGFHTQADRRRNYGADINYVPRSH